MQMNKNDCLALKFSYNAKHFRENDWSRVAGVVELVDTTDSKSVAFAGVPVQVRPPVPFSDLEKSREI